MQFKSRWPGLLVLVTLLFLLHGTASARGFFYRGFTNPHDIINENPWARAHENSYQVEASPTILYGVDVSEWQGTIDWDAMYSAADFVFMRSSYGRYSLDTQISRNQSEARRVGILRGYYHYSYPQYNEPEDEADNFVSVVGTLQTGECLCLDFEEDTTKDVVDWCSRFLNRVYQQTNVRPLLYINASQESSYDWSSVISGDYGLWLARWDGVANFSTPTGLQWPFMAFKQYSAAGSVAGISPIDLDIFNGGRAQFLAYGAQAPATPVVSITSPTTSSSYLTRSGSVVISGTASDSSGIAGVSWSSDRGSSGSCTGTTAWSTGSITLQPGQNVISVTALDNQGQQGTTSLTVTYDNLTPTLAITSPTTSGSYSTNSSSLSIGGTASDNVGLSNVKWTNSRGGSGTCTGTSTWSASGISLLSGVNVITVSATDTAGNISTASLTVTSDTTRPTVNIMIPTGSGAYVTASSTLAIGGTASDSVGVTSLSWTNSRGGSGTCIGTSSWSASGITLQSGMNVITVTASDGVGNTGTASLTVTLDNTAPSVAITSPTNTGSCSTKSQTLAIAGTASDNVSLGSVTWSNNRGGNGACAGTAGWSASGIALQSGVNVITVTATDRAGNSTSASISVTCDITRPTVTITSPTTEAAYSTKVQTLSIGGTASDDAGLGSIAWSNNRGGSGTCTGTSSWSASGISLQSGVNVITVTASDTVGNTTTATLTVTCDNTLPTVHIADPVSTPSYSTKSPSLSIAGTASDDVGVINVTWSNDRGGGGTCTGTDSWSASGISLQPGINVITVTASDGLGNKGVATLTVTCDTILPSLAITSPTTAATYETNGPFLTIGGTASDSSGLGNITWSNNVGGSGNCTGGASWNSGGITLQPGVNVITVTASDTLGNTKTASVTVTYVDTRGITWNGLAMVACPIIPSNTDPKTVIGFKDNSWYSYITDQNKYATYPDSLTLFTSPAKTPGKGFWARFNPDTPVPVGEIPSQSAPVTIHLIAGWNLVGQPFLSEMTWDHDAMQVVVSGQPAKSLGDSQGIVADFAWGWEQNPSDPSTGAYYLISDARRFPSAEHVLAPWRAYWVRAYAECDLILPPP